MVLVYDLCFCLRFITGFCLRFVRAAVPWVAWMRLSVWILRGDRGFLRMDVFVFVLQGSCQVASFRKLPQCRRGGAAVRVIVFCLIE